MSEKFASFVNDKLIKFLEETGKFDFSEISLQEKDIKISIIKSVPYYSQPVFVPQLQVQHHIRQVEVQPKLEIEEIKSNCVGIFYEYKDKKSNHVLKSGDTVNHGQILGFIQSMNLQFDVKSPIDGKILDIVVVNEEVVEYGRVLFKIVKEQEEF
jgi:acetyl-CoA carboxylase biotin carboxyl carrier protein